MHEDSAKFNGELWLRRYQLNTLMSSMYTMNVHGLWGSRVFAMSLSIFNMCIDPHGRGELLSWVQTVCLHPSTGNYNSRQLLDALHGSRKEGHERTP